MNGKNGRRDEQMTLMMCRKRIEILSLYEMLIFAPTLYFAIAATAVVVVVVVTITVHLELTLTLALILRQIAQNDGQFYFFK